MSNKPKARNYRGSDAKLTQTTDDVHGSAVRDAVELLPYGVDAATLTALMAARDAFENMPTDEELMGDMIIATQAKNATRTDVRQQIHQIADRARLIFGEQDGRYRKFGVEMLSRKKDDELLRCARRVVRVGTTLLAELASTGLTTGILTALTTAATTFDTQIDNQQDAIKDRDMAVDTRIGLGNDLYTLLVSLAGFGKLCWTDKNEAKYNDYILNQSSSGSHATEGNINGTSVVGTSVSGIEDATVLTLKNTGGAPLRFYFAVNPADPEGALYVEVAPNQSEDRNAAELGYTEQSYRLNVHNLTPTPGAYRVEWDD